MIARASKAGLTVLIALVIGLAARRAEAQCATDTDCPNAACGGEVCTKSSGLSSCNPANTQGGPGADGWCADANGVADDSKCKCRDMGAHCDGFYCTFTVPPTGTGGSTGTGGAGGGTGGTTAGGGGGCSIAGAPALGGAAGIYLVLAALLRSRVRRRG